MSTIQLFELHTPRIRYPDRTNIIGQYAERCLAGDAKIEEFKDGDIENTVNSELQLLEDPEHRLFESIRLDLECGTL